MEELNLKLLTLEANFPEFKPVIFMAGMNAVVAERTEESKQTDSRNGLGKTTLLALIDFSLGASAGERTDQLIGRDWKFTLTMRTRSGKVLAITRAVDTPSDIIIDGDVVGCGVIPFDPSVDARPTRATLGLHGWTKWLGREAYSLPTVDGPSKPPSFRSLIRHSIRYKLDAFVKPFSTFASQRPAQVQAENAFLLNLDWRIANEWQVLGDRKKRVALVDDSEDPLADQLSSLETQLVRLSRQSEALAAEIGAFSVLPEYRQMESQVIHWSKQIKELANENIADGQLIDLYRSRMEQELDTTQIDVERLFQEAGVHLGDAIVRSLDEAVHFQQQVVANRAAYLRAELQRLVERVTARDNEQRSLSNSQSTALQMLRSGGALEDFAIMQQKLASAQVAVAETEERMRTLRELRERKASIKLDELDLGARTDMDLDERFPRRASIVARFGEIMELLYGEQADLVVGKGKTGFQFKTKLPRVGSSGVEKMAIFSYDLAITEDMSVRGTGPGFLIHDSTMYDGVDERQVGIALDLVREATAKHNFQYVVALNSDMVPTADLIDRDAFDASVILTLTDADEAGGLLGMRVRAPKAD